MMIGESKITKMVLKMLGNNVIDEINYYIDDVSSRNFFVMNSLEDIDNLFRNSVDSFLLSLTEEELLDLRSYTGYNFKNINAILRGNWTYDVNGLLDQNKVNELRKLAANISDILGKFKTPSFDFVAFRGTTIKSFSDYGIRNIEDLQYLKGKYLYEQGFISTSLLEDTCYFNKKLETLENYNIEIKYLIPSEFEGGALIMDSNTTYSTNQNEFLLDNNSLSKVVDVVIDGDNAILTVVIIPKKIYDLNKNKGNNR